MAVLAVLVQAQVCRMLAGQSHLSSDLIQLLNRSLIELLRSAQHLRLVQKLRIEFHGFHLHVGRQQIGAPGQGAVILQKNRVIIRKILLHVVRNLVGGGRAVLRDRNAAQSDHRFRHDGLGQRNACDGKGRGKSGMSMYHSSHIRALLINAHVHLDLGRRTEALVRLDHVALRIHLADEFRGHEALGHAGGRAEEFIVVQLHGNVSVIGCNHVPVVDSLSDVADQFFQFVFVLHVLLHSETFYAEGRALNVRFGAAIREFATPRRKFRLRNQPSG